MAAVTPAPSGGTVGSVAWRLALRSLSLIPRVPATFIPSLIFPIFTVVVFSGAFGAVAQLPGFPVESMIDWMLPMAVVQGASFTGVTVGLGLARDLEGGFFDRLQLAPVRPVALVAGPALAAMFRALLPFGLVLTAGLVGGAHIRGGVTGVVVLFVAAEGVALVSSGWALGLALRFKTMKIGALMQVGVFVTVFLSTANVPIEYLTGWLHTVARFNPMTNVLALARAGFVGEVTWAGAWPGLVAIGGGLVVLGTFAVRGLRSLRP